MDGLVSRGDGGGFGARGQRSGCAGGRAQGGSLFLQEVEVGGVGVRTRAGGGVCGNKGGSSVRGAGRGARGARWGRGRVGRAPITSFGPHVNSPYSWLSGKKEMLVAWGFFFFQAPAGSWGTRGASPNQPIPPNHDPPTFPYTHTSPLYAPNSHTTPTLCSWPAGAYSPLHTSPRRPLPAKRRCSSTPPLV